MKDERSKAWELSPHEIVESEAEVAEILRDMRAGRIAAAAPSARRGAVWYLDWLDSDLPPGVQFPLGVNHWLREPVFPDDHPLFPSDDGNTLTWLDCHYTWKAVREARLVEQRSTKRHKPMPLCLVRCIHAAYERVTPERIADWCLALSPLKEPDVIAFILAEAPSDPRIRNTGNLIATRRAGFPALIDAQPGTRGQPKASTRDAYMLAALSALKRRFGGAIRYERKEGRKRKASPRKGMARFTPKSDWCAVVAPAFLSNQRPMKAQRLREMWDKLPKHERERIKLFHSPSVRFISE